MKQRPETAGHLAALFTVLIWGTTFISTKVLLTAFAPVEILFIRFLLGLAALFAACPRRLRGMGVRREAALAAAGLCGVCLYYLLENIALTYTMASNVGGDRLGVALFYGAAVPAVPPAGGTAGPAVFRRLCRGHGRHRPH